MLDDEDAHFAEVLLDPLQMMKLNHPQEAPKHSRHRLCCCSPHCLHEALAAELPLLEGRWNHPQEAPKHSRHRLCCCSPHCLHEALAAELPLLEGPRVQPPLGLCPSSSSPLQAERAPLLEDPCTQSLFLFCRKLLVLPRKQRF